MKTNLKQLRKESRLSEEQLAEYLGVTAPLFTEFEDGTSNMDRNQIEKICSLFRCSEAYLFDRSEEHQVLDLSFLNRDVHAEDLETIASINKITESMQNKF